MRQYMHLCISIIPWLSYYIKSLIRNYVALNPTHLNISLHSPTNENFHPPALPQNMPPLNSTYLCQAIRMSTYPHQPKSYLHPASLTLNCPHLPLATNERCWTQPHPPKIYLHQNPLTQKNGLNVGKIFCNEIKNSKNLIYIEFILITLLTQFNTFTPWPNTVITT